LRLSQGTTSSQKQETLFSKFQINYSTLPERFRKGSVLYRQTVTEPGAAPVAGITEETGHAKGTQRTLARKEVVVRHCDIIGRTFWEEQESILGDKEL
jgi:tRNA(His) guanylyltransferase